MAMVMVKMPRGKQAPNNKSPDKQPTRKTATRGAVAKQREIQRKADAKPAVAKLKSKLVQAGSRKQPANPLPRQHLKTPGSERDLDPQPRFLAPDYRGSGKLEDMAAIVTGGDRYRPRRCPRATRQRGFGTAAIRAWPTSARGAL